MAELIGIDLLRKMAGGRPDVDNMQSVVSGLSVRPSGLQKPHRLAHYLAQLMHESGRFRYDEELWGPTAAQQRYEGRVDLGNTEPGDGYKFRGRSGIQLTGRANYRNFTAWAREAESAAPDFETDPDLVNSDPWEGLAPIWYWDKGNPTGRSLNFYADQNNIEAITRKINGGLNGYGDRLQLYTRASLTLMGYPMEANVVRRFQQDQGFTGRDVDDIAGQKTRAAMHSVLVAMPPLDQPEHPPDEALAVEIRQVRDLIAQADQRLATIVEGD